MVADPRAVALKAWIEKRDKEAAAKELSEAIVDVLVSQTTNRKSDRQ